MGPSVLECSRPGPDVKGSTASSGPLRLPCSGGGNHRPTANAANAKSPNQPWLSGNQLELFPGPVPVAADCRRHDSSSRITGKGKLLGASRKLQKSQDLHISPATLTPDPETARASSCLTVSSSLCATDQHRTAPGPLSFRLSPSPSRLVGPRAACCREAPTTRVLPTRHVRRVVGDSASLHSSEIAPCMFAHCSPVIAPSSKWLHTSQNVSRPPSSAK